MPRSESQRQTLADRIPSWNCQWKKREFEAVSSCRNLSELQRVIGSCSGVACRDVLVREKVNQVAVNLEQRRQLAFGPSGLHN